LGKGLRLPLGGPKGRRRLKTPNLTLVALGLQGLGRFLPVFGAGRRALVGCPNQGLGDA